MLFVEATVIKSLISHPENFIHQMSSLSLEVEPNLVHELLFNHEHPDYIGMPSDNIGITLSVDLTDSYNNIKKR